ncbi:Copper resistance protein B precursor [Brevundimonas diminuta]|uniref:copper resistance protein B n=1 Tax=Brevundimonas diminuta TaxID=293 RepID=UPI0003150D79|nr:copper resistance protein B [Brevundimonas diminuta]WQE46616.1 copper resistance protein B [Brevundimonas diminuta]SPU47925.1 Copper resistance protein B precursor [Brevundimonas diminuta]SUW15871.1 Copper resistance protein B precursor [Brevundimonas diminuta]
MKSLSLSLALAPLMLAAGGPALAQSHAGHAAHVPAAAPAAQATPSAAKPAHDCPMMREGKPCPMHGAASGAQSDPHAGHDMSGHAGHGAAPVDAHAGHNMAPAQAAPANPHAGHDMAPAHAAQADPHADHNTALADPHAGHDMSGHAGHGAPAVDPHAGHDMSVARGGPNIPTSVDAVGGRMVETPPPAAARSAPAHAADLLFDPAVMAASRKQLLVENGDIRTTAVLIDSIEASFGDGADGYSWGAQGWTGGDINRFWWKTEGEGEIDGKLHEAEVQALYSRAIAPFWDVQAGVRQDFRPDGDDTTHLTVGVQGVAPYWFEMSAAAFLSTEGDLTARAEAEYDQRITQKWILQPAIEVALSASDIPELEIDSGLTSVTAGLRLRYEIRKEFAPYVGVEWTRSLGDTADYAKARGQDPEDTRFVVGIKAWF